MILGPGDSRVPHEVEADRARQFAPPGVRFVDRLRGALPGATAEIKAVSAVRPIAVAAIGEARRMASLAAVSDRIKAKKLAYAAKAEGWAARLDALDAREPEAFAATEAALALNETDLSGMEADMRALTNGAPAGPLPGLQGGSNG